uniref:F-box domain-containing protein n=1 Tax=Rhabditophanes sp. KR3021 TaxID=114890 RepID=A0AC35UEW6_9BILA
MKEIKLLVPVKDIHFESRSIEKVSFDIFKIEFEISLYNADDENTRYNVAFLERFEKVLNDIIGEKNKNQIILTVYDHYGIRIPFFERICKLNYINVEYNLNEYEFFKHTLEWTPRSSFGSLKNLILDFQPTPSRSNFLENVTEIVNNLSYLSNLNIIVLHFNDITKENIGQAKIDLLENIVFGLPESVHTLKLINIPIILNNERLSKTLPNLKFLMLTTVLNEYGDYEENYFMAFQQLQVLNLGCVGKKEFAFPQYLRVLFEFCLVSNNADGYNGVNYQDDPQLNEFGEKDLRDSEDDYKFSVAEHNTLQDETFRNKTCNCGTKRRYLKNVQVQNWYRNSFKCISFATVNDWDLYLKTTRNVYSY